MIVSRSDISTLGEQRELTSKELTVRHLDDLARQIAEAHQVSPTAKGAPDILNRLKSLENLSEEGYQYFLNASEAQLRASYAAEWILDNYYIIQQIIRQIREDLPRGYYQQLPKLANPDFKGLPRIYVFVEEFIRICQSQIDIDRLTRFTDAYQEVTPLTSGELWALPIMLRYGILKDLTSAITIITGIDVPDIVRDFLYQDEPETRENDTIVASGIISFRTLATVDWKSFFESVSLVEETLRLDPAEAYPLMDFDTRDSYRDVIEELALVTGFDELRVTQTAIELSQEVYARETVNSTHLEPEYSTGVHVGYYLLDEGCYKLEDRLGYRPSPKKRLLNWVLKHPTFTYLGTITLLALLILSIAISIAIFSGGTLLQVILVGLLTSIPVTTTATSLSNRFFTNSIPPRVLPKMDFESGISEESETVVVIPSLLSGAEDIEYLLQQLELHYLGNIDPHIHFALLTDFTDAYEEHIPVDEDLLEQAIAGIRALNNRYSSLVADGEGVEFQFNPFLLFHRKRKWNPSEGCWMGWERKRGKLEEFNKLITGHSDTSYEVLIGDLEILSKIKFVITLDTDTTLPRGNARRLVATLAHPLNRARYDNQGNLVRGYTILQPRIQTKPTSANLSLLTQIFSGATGLDPYTLAVSDVYQDLFGEGIYVGKGIYDVDAFHRSLEGKVPENKLLSHDLFEGIHGRVGLVTDISLFEDYPSHYLVRIKRTHRWVRGDWQLLPWLLPRVPHTEKGTIKNQLSVIDRWKMVDNLRRSLFKPALLLLLIVGWMFLPGSPLIWISAVIFFQAVPVLISILSQTAIRQRNKMVHGEKNPLTLSISRTLLVLAFLPYEALIISDAIISTLIRMTFTRKKYLQWQTSAHTVHIFGREVRLALLWVRMGAGPITALLLSAITAFFFPESLPYASPLLLTWFISPLIAHWISKPLVEQPTILSETQVQVLRRLAGRTWLFFESYVRPEDNWLPPDHFQEDPRGLVARRTSPTNIGLLLLSTLSAFDLGYLDLISLSLRLNFYMDSIRQLEKYRGHLLNWYNTSNLDPLPPRYISTVDSGNLAASLLTLRQGILELPDSSLCRWEYWQGFLDFLGIIQETLENVPPSIDREPLLKLLSNIRQRILTHKDKPEEHLHLLKEVRIKDWDEFNRLLVSLVKTHASDLDTTYLSNLRIWCDRVSNQLVRVEREIQTLIPWLEILNQPPEILSHEDTDPLVRKTWEEIQKVLTVKTSLIDIPEACREAQVHLGKLHLHLQSSKGKDIEYIEKINHALEWCEELKEELDRSRLNTNALVIGYRNLGDTAEDFYQKMDFDFLYNPHRKVFHIGYNLDSGKLDDSYYDLLASEARIASYLAIAKGDIPQSHWLHLGRPLAQFDGTTSLLSWSGTMFEYLMPPLLMESNRWTLLDQSCRAAVQRQIAYGNQKHVPWGISESGFYHFDSNQNYQYKAFGVPGLGFKRGLSEDLVIAPYASLLALEYDPHAVMNNIAQLRRLGALGVYGFYEALDFTHNRLVQGQKYEVVRSYYAHHQGMILLALNNYLKNKSMVRRFHANPLVKSVDLLLHEYVPQQPPMATPHPDESTPIRPIKAPVALEPWRPQTDAPVPQVHYLSNGRFGTLVTHSGGGYCHWNGIGLTRWRADTTADDWGTWIYVKDLDNGTLWSAGFQPTSNTPGKYEVSYSPHKAEFQHGNHDITLKMEIVVPPDDDLEIRKITLSNLSSKPRRIFISSYGELILAPQRADRRHPAFNKLFIESDYIPDINTLVFRRRPRSSEEIPIFLAHTLIVDQESEGSMAYETDRANFIGRGGNPRSPLAFHSGGNGGHGNHQFTRTIGPTLDPIMALGREITLPPHKSVQAAFITGVSHQFIQVIGYANRYHTWAKIERSFDHARSFSEQELSQLDLNSKDIKNFQKMLSLLFFPHRSRRADPSTLAANSRGQSNLWPYAISGDYPILLVRIGQQEEINLVVELLKAHRYWRNQNVLIDLVILNLHDTSYDQDLHNLLLRIINRSGGNAWFNRRGGIFLLSVNQIDNQDIVLLESAARVVLNGERGALNDQLKNLFEQTPLLPQLVPTLPPLDPSAEPPPITRPEGLLFDNGLGGFSQNGKEYLIYLEPGQWTPAPWVNVIANPEFGFLVSESGGGYTWAQNSGENRLTNWRNDPLLDTPSEAIYLRDEDTGQVWSPTPLPVRTPAPYLVRHGTGYTIFEHNSHGLKQKLTMFAAKDAPVKIVQLRLVNLMDRTRRITATYFAEWILGTDRDTMAPYLITEFDTTTHSLLVRNPYNAEFGRRVAFLTSTREPHGLTVDRAEFLGRNGSARFPEAIERVGLTGTVETGRDPCGVLRNLLWIAPGETKEITFLLGQGEDYPETIKLIEKYQAIPQIETAWEQVNDFWDDLLGTVTVKTPDPAMDLMLNRWLLYQSLSCRIWGRSALYQSSGAYGFRDQLQDVMAFVHAAPEITREHIIRAAQYQFKTGDVLHWWHPPSGRGVRTRCSDDLLWLPYTTATYILASGDESILDEEATYLDANPLEPEEHERYANFKAGETSGNLFEHCQRALTRGSTSGPHGLPLIGSHDWNDGMNRIGYQGKGESVWNGWFIYDTLNKFAQICDRVEVHDKAAIYRSQAEHYRRAIEEQAWDGLWYRRAFYDDGTPVGSAESDENQIDSLPQSWGVLSKGANPLRAVTAMDSVFDQLVQPEDRLILLFTPPFDNTKLDPGYVKGYPPGVRENGGQYTHAAIWAAWAFAELNQGNRAMDMFSLLNPIYHSDTADKIARYRTEPYVVAADIASEPPHTGRGGWTWYTGSASWLYRLGLEGILGIKREGKMLRIDPRISKSWSNYEVSYRYGGSTYLIYIDNPEGCDQGVKRILLDDKPVEGTEIPLSDDGMTHIVRVLLWSEPI
jgi:cyclic beta-1,2-glucan synthetase